MTRPSAPEEPSPRLLEELEWQVCRELVKGMPPAERAGLGLGADELPGAGLITLTRYPQVLDFNRTLLLGVSRPATQGTLEGLRALARDRGLPQVMVGLIPGARPDDLRARLLALGARPARAWMLLWREATVRLTPPPGVEVRAMTPDGEDTFSEVMLRGFSLPADLAPLTRATNGRPGWTHYLAWRDGHAVACGSLYLNGSSAWLGNATTLPAWRRHGAQAALISRRIADAARAGARMVFTQVAEDLPEKPNPSEHNMRRAGFRPVCRRDHLILPSGLGS